MTDVPPPPSSSFGTPPPANEPDAVAALAYGWKRFTENAAALIVVAIPPVLLIAGVVLISILGVHGVFPFLGFLALATFASNVAYIGLFNAALSITAGAPVEIGKAFSSDRWGTWIGFSLLYGLLLGVGMIFCGAGALLAVAFFGLAPFYVLEQGKSIGDAFAASWAATRSHPGLPFALAVTAVASYVGVVVCFVPGLVTLPLGIVAAASLYRRVNDEPLAS